VILYDHTALEPGENNFARLRLRVPVLLLPGDPFVLRSFSPRVTIGGGTVLDPFPPPIRRRTAETMSLLTMLESGDVAGTIAGLITLGRMSGVTLEEVIQRTGFSQTKIDAALGLLQQRSEIRQLVRDPRTFMSRDAFKTLTGFLLDEIRRYLAQNPLKQGIGREELKTRMPRRSNPRFFASCLETLESEGKVKAERDLIALLDRESVPGNRHADTLNRIAEILNIGGLEPPSLKEMGVREGRAVKVKGDLFYAPDAIVSLHEKVLRHLSAHPEMTPAQFRDMTGLSRKFMIPVLEYFDAQKITIRVGDKRVLRGGRESA
jgi:selenocysteine-specific elongation factor